MTTAVILTYAVVMSLIALILYGRDKRKAKKGAWRTPEAVLLGIGLLGGSMGALLGMYLFRHKTKHWYFWLFNWIGFAILIAVLWYTARDFSEW